MDATLQSFLIAVTVLLFVMLIMFACLMNMRIKDKKAVLDLSECKGRNLDYLSYLKMFAINSGNAKNKNIQVIINIRHEIYWGAKQFKLAINDGTYYLGKFYNTVTANISLDDTTQLSFHLIDERNEIIYHFFSEKEYGENFEGCIQADVVLLARLNKLEDAYTIKYTYKN